MAYTLKKRLKRGIIKVYQNLSIDKLFMNAGFFDKSIDKAIKKLSKKSIYSNKYLKKDIKRSYNKYLTTPDEYFLFDFPGKDENYRKLFLTDKARIRLLIKYVGERKFVEDLCDKYNFYKRTSQFFKRQVVVVGGNKGCTFIDFCNFVLKYKKVFVKPLSDSYGKGAHILTIENEDTNSLKSLFQKYSLNDWIFEECIIQSKEMAEWNQSSVNTVRLPCFLSKGKFYVLNPFFRTGREGAVVDNAGGGGIFACIDENTGKIVTDGIDESNITYKSHPNSKKDYMGWQIPRWNELLEVAEKMFRECLPDHKYIGFDFALTDNGWVLIEGNWGQFVGQYASKIGVADMFKKYIETENGDV